MKRLVGGLLGAAAVLMGTAQAGIGEAEVKQLIASKGMILVAQDVEDGGKLRVFLATEPSGWPQAVSLVDVDLDGSTDILMLMSFVPGAGGVPLGLLNQVNESAVSKAFTIENAAGFSLATVVDDKADIASMTKAFDMYYGEFTGYRQAMISLARGGGNTLGVSVSTSGLSPADRADAGLTRREVTLRDDLLTKSLNVGGSHTDLGGTDQKNMEEVLELAAKASRRLLRD